MNPELELVARLSRIAPTDTDLARALTLATGAMRWGRVRHLATEHRVAPLVATNFLRLALPADLAPVCEDFRQLRRTSTVADSRRFDQWLMLLRTFDAHNISVMTLRGFHVALSIYGKVGRRQVPKLDFLIHRRDIAQSIALLEGLGYCLEGPPFAAHTTTATLLSADGRLALHWDADDLLSTAEPLEVNHQTLLVPPRTTMVALLLAHGHRSSWERLGYLVDVAEGLDQLSAAECQALPVLDDALQRIHTMWGRVPSPGGEPIAFTPTQRAVVPLTFVTAIYDSGPDSLLGGRGWNIDYYLPSLINIANLGAPIVLFCAPQDVDRIEDAIAPYFCDCRVVPWALEQFEHFAAFVAWKRTYRSSLALNNRNEVLCFLKSWWVQQAIVDNPFGHDLFFWIDAGLTHHGIFPERLGGVELRINHPASRYHPQNKNNIFTPALGEALAQSVTPGRVSFCALPSANQARRAAYEQIIAPRTSTPDQSVSITDHLVGGLFGGYRSDVARVHQHYAEVLKTFIDTRTYTLEEQVFSSVHALHPELFALQRFDTWHFFAPGERTGYLPTEGNSFYKIFTNLLGLR